MTIVASGNITAPGLVAPDHCARSLPQELAIGAGERRIDTLADGLGHGDALPARDFLQTTMLGGTKLNLHLDHIMPSL